MDNGGPAVQVGIRNTDVIPIETFYIYQICQSSYYTYPYSSWKFHFVYTLY